MFFLLHLSHNFIFYAGTEDDVSFVYGHHFTIVYDISMLCCLMRLQKPLSTFPFRYCNY